MIPPVDGFDWDIGNRSKCQAHGVSIADIEALLSSNPHVAPDLKHSASEPRLIAVGRSSRGRPMFVAFTFRRKDELHLIRPISARYMHEKEIAGYETEGA
jgi:uncharacterized DUF497 family protein